MKDTFHQFDMILRPWSFTSLEQHLEFFDTGIVVEQLDSRKKIIESYRMIYFGIVLNGSIVSRFILERGSVFKFCVCVCLSYKYVDLYWKPLHRPTAGLIFTPHLKRSSFLPAKSGLKVAWAQK